MAYSNTSVVLVDNLLSLLDETTADKIFNALFSSAGLLHQQGRTSVVATHRRKTKRSESLNDDLILFEQRNTSQMRNLQFSWTVMVTLLPEKLEQSLHLFLGYIR